MHSPIARGFNIVDGLLLISASALGFAVWKHNLVNVWGIPWRGSNVDADGVPLDLDRWVDLASVLVACQAWGTIALRLRRPRPRLCRLGRQPGFIACVAVSLSSLLDTMMRLVGNRAALHGNLADAIALRYSESISPWSLGPAVIVTWTCMTLAVGWRPERSWIDRFGRLQGCYWIIAAGFCAWRGT